MVLKIDGVEEDILVKDPAVAAFLKEARTKLLRGPKSMSDSEWNKQHQFPPLK